MKALVYEGVSKVKVREVRDPSLRESDDILIRVTSASICGSDLHLLHGMIPHLKKGTVLGHEAMGVVEETGTDVTGLRQGDRVLIPFPVACGRCWFCEHGFWNQCDNSNDFGEAGGVLGYGELFGGYDGGQAEYLRVPFANVGPVRVPEQFRDEEVLFLTDILPTSYWAVDYSGVKPGDTVCVLGCGPVGLLCIKWALFKGAKRVIAVDCVDYRLARAAQYGAETVNFETQDHTGDVIREMTHGGADVVLDCVGMDGKKTGIETVETALHLQGGSKSAIELAAQAVRKCGNVLFVGIYGQRYNMFPFGDFYARSVVLKTGTCPAHSYIPVILNLIEKGKFSAADLITHTLTLEDAEKGYRMFDQKKENCIKVVLKP